MKQQITEVYNLGLEKYAGDEQKAKEFTVGFMKEAMDPSKVMSFGQAAGTAIGQGFGAGAAAVVLGLGIHGMSSTFNQMGLSGLREKFQAALSKAVATNTVLMDADRTKVNSYAETIFKFAPHVSADPNLLASILANAVHGEGLDPMTIRTLADLEGRIQESRKNALFSPKAYT